MPTYKAFHYQSGHLRSFYPIDPPPQSGIRGWSTPALQTSKSSQPSAQQALWPINSGINLLSRRDRPQYMAA